MTEKMSEEEIIERLETSERTIEDLKTSLGNSLKLVQDLLDKQTEMAREKRVLEEANRTLAHNIASYIELPADLVAEKIVTVKTANKEIDDVIQAVKKNAEEQIEKLGGGKVTKEIIEKLVKHIQEDVSVINTIATLIGEGDIEEGIAEHIDAENVAYHIDAENVAYHISASEVAQYIDHGDVAGYVENCDVAEYIDEEDVAGHLDLNDVAGHIDLEEIAGHIDLDALASKVKELMD
jgi:hypothetical protein